MANLVVNTNYGKNQKQILIGQDSYYIGLPIILNGEANETLLAGQPLAGDIADRDAGFEKVDIEGGGDLAGVLLHDVVLDQDGKGNGTIVLAGCVDLLKLDESIQDAIAQINYDTLNGRIIFVKGSAI